jgi:pilus assembly protein Flp/PilA
MDIQQRKGKEVMAMLCGLHEKGQGLVEYALLLALVALVVIVVLLVLGPVIGNVFSNLNSTLLTV